ncbi:hypothetical protein Y5W_01882 [Alcanivorax sp. 521-1]|uniref:Uncharacterized protein n=1 Tax=Alloalcanivorax profundimaris TaxID=2735259 RepID=A0ABS0AR65_9GAMM|nr:hypothetical protein [Alloalcanivorax profundimaris]MBF5056588.1 hypothetical protein [Alloalcanivorax profundimaris]
MLGIGLILLALNIVVRGFLFPAEYSMANDPGNLPRIFFSPAARGAYLVFEWISRWLGSVLVVMSVTGLEMTLFNLIVGGLATGLLSMLVAPALALLIATRIDPHFKATLKGP